MINKNLLTELIEVVPNDREIAIINIGTDGKIFDALAPLVGSFLKEKDLGFKVYGDIDNPIHALNINEKLTEINKIHKNDYIIGIDACISDITPIGEIRLKRKSIKPGLGVGKNIKEVGDIGIIGVTTKRVDFSLKACRLSLVINMAREIADTLVAFDRIRKGESTIEDELLCEI